MHPEIEAMAAIVDAFDGLDDDAIGRVLRWANDRYAATPAAGPSSNDAARALEAMDAEAAWLKEQADKSGEQDYLVRALTAESLVSTVRRALTGDPAAAHAAKETTP